MKNRWHVVFVDEEGVTQLLAMTLEHAYLDAVDGIRAGDIERPFIYYGTRRPDEMFAA